MLDIKLIRENADAIEKKLQTKEPGICLKNILELDSKLRQLKTDVETKKAQRNDLSKSVGEKKRKGENVEDMMAQATAMGEEIQKLDNLIPETEAEFINELAKIPNIPYDEIKVSQNPADNVVVKLVGSKPTFNFPFKNHLELNEKLRLFDFERAAKTSGSGWPAYRGMGARLEWALIQYMIATQVKNGFEQWIPPLVVRPEMLFGAGQFPKFVGQQFQVQDDDNTLYLIPTSEVVLNGLHYDEILDEKDLPLLYTAYTPCFRREAGAAGKNERGLIRTHQFNKVEMFAFTRPEDSDAVFDKMIASAEEILQGLELHYRNALLVTGDMSFASRKTIDIEVWLPGQDRYYEVSSVSNCGDYQARRSKIRYRKDGKPQLVHTLNGSGLATSRLMVALLENNQNADGSINIPKALHPYMNGVTKLVP
jgi:seryl-tRNA synthetase